jgi:hypothetical protein
MALQGGRIVLNGSESIPAEDRKAAVGEWRWSARDDNPAPLQMETGGVLKDVNAPAISITLPEIDGEYYLHLRVKDELGRQDTHTVYFAVENGEARIPDYDHENPAWIETAVVYGIVPFLFGSPAFRALGEHLDDLADLGVNAIWLGPINTHPVDDYGYAVEDYFGLDPAYGTKEDFRIGHASLFSGCGAARPRVALLGLLRSRCRRKPYPLF